jgi:3-hydroxybutyrate dehydrogenase
MSGAHTRCLSPTRRIRVTGSMSGIGLGIARALAAAGMHVVLNGFGEKAQSDKLVAACRAKRCTSTAAST